VATGAARPSVTDETPVSTGAATQAPANDPQVRAAA
jgi:hypothetical protein